MTFRRLAAALPLAVLAAIVAHVVGFGGGHTPGGAHAAPLFAVLGTALALLAGAAFAAGWFRGSSRSITPQRVVDYARALIPLALGALAALEIAEGHLTLASGFVSALLALVPVVLVVSALAGLLGRSLARAGGALAEAAERLAVVTSTFAHSSTRGFGPAASRLLSRATRGRAPPALA